VSDTDAESAEDTAASVDDGTVANAQGALDVVEQTSTTVDEQLDGIATRTDEQASDAADAVDEIAELSATIEEIAATASEVSERSERTAEQATEGRAAAREAMDVMESMRATGEAVAREVETLTEHVERIETALSGIDEIAEQTNMLALNASIEAARAGEAGDGFGVVADEVKELAADAQRQADEIDTILSEVRQATDETVDELDDAVDEIDRGAEQVAATMSNLDDITEAVEETAAGIQSVSTATDEQAETSEAVTRRVERVAERADAIEDDVDAIRDARSEQTAMLGEIGDVLDAAAVGRSERLRTNDRLSTGVDAVDTLCNGGIPVGSQAVLQHDGTSVAPNLIATLCASALAADRAVSLTPPPGLDRHTLAAALTDRDRSLEDDLAAGRLFVLDAFDEWADERNVFDLGRQSLSEANRRTDERRDRPLLVIGNIAGEIAVMGERAAREARYENDDGVLGERDTVVNVVDTSTVDDRFRAFYTGAADQVVDVYRDGDGQHVELLSAPGPAGGTRPLSGHGVASHTAERR
jgi:archaellum component FlaC